MLEKRVLTILELIWNQHLGHREEEIEYLSSYAHVVHTTKCQKMKYARAKRAKILFSIVKYANLWGFVAVVVVVA